MIQINKNTTVDFDLLFAGFFVDDDTFSEATKGEKFPQHAAHRFQKNIIDMLLKLEWSSVDILGSIPVSTFPKNGNIVFFPKSWNYANHKGYMIPIINIPVLRAVSRLVGFFIYLVKWNFFKKNSDTKQKVIFLYALHSPHFIPVYLMRILFGVKVFVFIPDLPKFMHGSDRLFFLKKWMKNLDSRLLLWLVNNIDGRIVITEGMFSFLERENSLLLDSISSDNIASEDVKFDTPIGKNIFYSGGLSEEYGILDLVKCFTNPKIVEKGLNLVLCGGGPLSEWCSHTASENHNIYYLGILKNEDVVSIQQSSFALINLRQNTADYTKYSFPSKIAEYIQSGVPVITTALDGIPQDLIEYLNIVSGNPVDVILDIVDQYPDAQSKARKGADFYNRSRSSRKQAKRFDIFFTRTIQRGLGE
ncbi:MAG: glycosyltransferase [Pseudomonadales bacterium]|nr:glycosyltransferase [Pseudomonadales bacterium]